MDAIDGLIMPSVVLLGSATASEAQARTTSDKSGPRVALEWLYSGSRVALAWL